MKQRKLIEKFAELSKPLYTLCSKKELIRRKCVSLGRMECELLNYLTLAERAICMNDLSVEMKVSHSRITRIIDTLVKKKYVRRFPSKKDRRSWLAEITEKGKEVNEETLKDYYQIQADLISHLPEDRVEEIHEAVVYFMAAYQHALLQKESRDMAELDALEK